MKKLFIVIFGIWAVAFGALGAGAQDSSDLWLKIDAFSESVAANDVFSAANLAAELANVDFTKQGFTHHESGEFRAGFAEALFEAGRYKHAADLLDAIAVGDHAAFEIATSPEEKAFYRNVVIERLERRVEMAQANNDGNAEIQNLAKIHVLKLDVLGPGHPELTPVTNKLLGHLRARAIWKASVGEGKSGVADIKDARQIAIRSHAERVEVEKEIEQSIFAMTNQVADESEHNGDRDGAISWLEAEKAHWSDLYVFEGRTAFNDKLFQLYRKRAAFFRSTGDFDRAISDLRTARTLRGSADVTRELAEVLLESARNHQQLGQHEAAYEDAAAAEELGVYDAALKERAFRDWKGIPEGEAFQYPIKAPVGEYAPARYSAATRTESITPLPPFREVRVFYGTNRTRKGEKYTRVPSDGLQYGWAKVTVPEKRNPGDIPKPYPGFRAKDNLHIILKHSTPYSSSSEFGRQLRSSLLCAELFFFEDAREPECVAETSKKSELFVFIHGHNVPFKGAAMRTAQLAVDLDVEHGAVFFAWPTGRHALDYKTSRTNADASVTELVSFLETVIGESQADEIHLIAHSMGNRLLLRALNKIKTKTPPNTPVLFDNIIFGSPDVDEGEFANSVRRVESLSNSMTLYGSKKDKALQLSSKVPDNERRAGLSPPSAEIINASEKLVFIDTSELKRRFRDFIDHADFTAGAFNDVRGVIWTGESPDNRCALSPATRGPRPLYWKALTRNAKCHMQSYGERVAALREQEVRPIIRKLSDTLLPTRPIRPKNIITRVDE